MLPVLGWHECRVNVRQHPGGRACHRAGGCPDALALQGQRGRIRGGRSCLVPGALLRAKAIAFAVHPKDVHVVGQAVRQRTG